MKKTRFIYLMMASALLVSPLLVFGQDESFVTNEGEQEEAHDPISAAVLYQPFDGEEEYPEQEAIVVAEDPIAAFSVGDLERMINPPSRLKEYQEDLENPQSLFTAAEHAAIFGETPAFIYYPEGPDPMIIPWVRDRVVAEEMFADAMVAKANNDFEKAKELLNVVREKYPNTTQGQQAPAELNQIERLIADANRPAESSETGIAPPPVAKIMLPQWVRQNTTAIIIRENPVALVGNDFLRTGDPVPRYPSVRVQSIAPSEVVYSYQDEEFQVEVSGRF